MIDLNKDKAIREILRTEISGREELMALKRRISKKYGIAILSNAELLRAAAKDEQETLRRVLRKRAIRTLSGIAPVAVLTKPFPCPGKCVYCPTEKDVPQSYLSNEPAVMRAIRSDYDPYLQVQQRLRALEANGHHPTKIEIIIIGGTWSVLPRAYKYWYIKEVFRAANDYPATKTQRVGGTKERNLLKEQKRNEKAEYRIVGLTLETRPDYIDEKELEEMRELGSTRVELGVQAIDDQILKFNRRGHGVKEVARATELLRNYGFKITYHLMPALPGATPAKDLKMFRQLFADERFQPDQIKFYPTVVTKGSLLYRWWRAGRYKPYSGKQLEDLIIKAKGEVPPYVRIIRLIRDIPAESILAGNKITNLRQVLEQKGVSCDCIRCREVRGGSLEPEDLRLRLINYRAAAGEEFFIEATDKEERTLYGFCRLRLARQDKDGPFRLRGAALVRELHVYGELVPLGKGRKVQHAGLGKLLLGQAERIARENGFKKMAVISGVGARDYYRKQGYKLSRGYMVKLLT